MGKKSSSSTTKPPKEFMPYILGGANTVQGVYGQNAGKIQGATDAVTSLLPGQIDKFNQGNPVLSAAQGYSQDVLGGKYLDQGNPYLQKMLDASNNDIRNQTAAGLGVRGLTGGSAFADVISRNIANNENQMRGQAYQFERGMQGQSASMAPGMLAADNARLSPLLQLLGAHNAPLDAAQSYAGSLGGLLGQYGTQSKNPSTVDKVGQGIETAAMLASLFSDERLKTDIEHVGETDGGLPVYEFRYVWGPERYRGVMAQDVALFQPEALGPVIGGYMTVNYAEVR